MRPLSVSICREGLAEALVTIRHRPLRAALAALAMAAAVATTAIVQTALDALARSARETSARAFGSDAFVIARYASVGTNRRELTLKIERNPPISRSDVRFLDGVAAGRLFYAATTQRVADVIAGSRKFENATVTGTQAALAQIRDVGIARGRFFTATEERSGAQVAILGQAAVDELFPSRDPLGAMVRIGNRGFRVVGVQSAQGISGSSLDRYVWIPIAVFERIYGAPESLQVFARATDVDETAAAEDHARTSMRARRHLAPGDADTFDFITPEASRTFVTAVAERIGAAGPPISAMALLAAIVVVTNTILVSVAQRTREIGVRRAVGAPRASILIETLAEAAAIAVAGGLVGLVVALGILDAASTSVGLPLALEWRTAAASLAAAGLSGLVAGWYPARRASRLPVVLALRQES